MHKLEINRFSLHKFNDRKDIKFDITEYSKLKYGSNTIGVKYGSDLAKAFFAQHYDIIVNKQLVVTESAYQYVHNAASMISESFINTLNDLIVDLNGNFIHKTKINRTVPYVEDCGKLSLIERVNLLKQDDFTFDYEYCKDKFIIIIDDIFITGTHQAKIEEMMDTYKIDKTNCMCVYYAELLNPDEDPSIEAYLNNAYINTLLDLTQLINNDSNYKVIVRTLKMLLKYENTDEVKTFLTTTNKKMLNEIYNGCLGEGYYKMDAYSKNFSLLREIIKK